MYQDEKVGETATELPLDNLLIMDIVTSLRAVDMNFSRVKKTRHTLDYTVTSDVVDEVLDFASPREIPRNAPSLYANLGMECSYFRESAPTRGKQPQAHSMLQPPPLVAQQQQPQDEPKTPIKKSDSSQQASFLVSPLGPTDQPSPFVLKLRQIAQELASVSTSIGQPKPSQQHTPNVPILESESDQRQQESPAEDDPIIMTIDDNDLPTPSPPRSPSRTSSEDLRATILSVRSMLDSKPSPKPKANSPPPRLVITDTCAPEDSNAQPFPTEHTNQKRETQKPIKKKSANQQPKAPPLLGFVPIATVTLRPAPVRAESNKLLRENQENECVAQKGGQQQPVKIKLNGFVRSEPKKPVMVAAARSASAPPQPLAAIDSARMQPAEPTVLRPRSGSMPQRADNEPRPQRVAPAVTNKPRAPLYMPKVPPPPPQPHFITQPAKPRDAHVTAATINRLSEPKHRKQSISPPPAVGRFEKTPSPTARNSQSPPLLSRGRTIDRVEQPQQQMYSENSPKNAQIKISGDNRQGGNEERWDGAGGSPAWDRLYLAGLEAARARKERAEQKEREEKERVMGPFKPKISAVARRLVPSKDVVSRLMDRSTTQQKIERMREELEAKRVSECTFSPRINQRSHSRSPSPSSRSISPLVLPTEFPFGSKLLAKHLMPSAIYSGSRPHSPTNYAHQPPPVLSVQLHTAKPKTNGVVGGGARSRSPPGESFTRDLSTTIRNEMFATGAHRRLSPKKDMHMIDTICGIVASSAWKAVKQERAALVRASAKTSRPDFAAFCPPDVPPGSEHPIYKNLKVLVPTLDSIVMKHANEWRLRLGLPLPASCADPQIPNEPFLWPPPPQPTAIPTSPMRPYKRSDERTAEVRAMAPPSVPAEAGEFSLAQVFANLKAKLLECAMKGDVESANKLLDQVFSLKLSEAAAHSNLEHLPPPPVRPPVSEYPPISTTQEQPGEIDFLDFGQAVGLGEAPNEIDQPQPQPLSESGARQVPAYVRAHELKDHLDSLQSPSPNSSGWTQRREESDGDVVDHVSGASLVHPIETTFGDGATLAHPPGTTQDSDTIGQEDVQDNILERLQKLLRVVEAFETKLS